ncbi:MAG: SMP-30/gluconolactonase/LRE family protein [SAR202 cluster bacterium]|nr:SMP-30/gluconolactonase/LRE family protein [SAR202 cluster bacterium]|tara:strand:+ start:827 stop:1687 length:861 start_codon:yes stop_codon:yes gene_type:complete
MTILTNGNDVSVLVDGLDHPEGVAWGQDGFAYAGGEAGQIYRIDIELGQAVQFAQAPNGFILGMAIDADNNIYACDTGSHSVLRITQGGAVSTYSRGASDAPFHFPNYPAFDSQGNLFVASSGDWNASNGRVFKVRAGGEAEIWSDELADFPNGLCMGPDENHLYVAMSLNPPRVIRINIQGDGGPGEIETVANLPQTVPDGLAFDTNGNLYISCYRPDRIYRLSPTGNLEVLAEDYEGTLIAAPTNIAFCGPDRDILVSANLGRWHLTRYEAGVRGMRLHHPRVG